MEYTIPYYRNGVFFHLVLLQSTVRRRRASASVWFAQRQNIGTYLEMDDARLYADFVYDAEQD